MKTRSQTNKELEAVLTMVRSSVSDSGERMVSNVIRRSQSSNGITSATTALHFEPTTTTSRDQGMHNPTSKTIIASHSSFADVTSSKQLKHSGSTRTSRSAATVLAQQLATEAQFARRKLERERILMERERVLMEHENNVEQCELRAELAAMKADHVSLSGKSRATSSVADDRTKSWLQECTNADSEVNTYFNNLDRESILAAQCDNGIFTLPDKSTPTAMRDTNPLLNHNSFSTVRTVHPNTVEYVAPLVPDTVPTSEIAQLAKAITALASTQNRPRKPKYVELAYYNGNPSEWLAFKRTFDDTKSSYSPTENLARLRYALRGRAREAVAALLVSADQPEEVMQMLEQSCARPELIVQQEVASLRNLPRLNNDCKDLNTFACRVRNCVATVRMLQQVEYLHSPEIFNSLLGKLTPLIRTRWTDYASEAILVRSKLENLSEFLVREADRHIKFGMIPEVTNNNFQQTLAQHNKYNNTQSNKRENIHTASVSHVDPVCLYCKRKHNIANCKNFKTLTVDDRWSWVRESKVCYKCLKGGSHSWNKCKGKRCGIDGCIRTHHDILHNNSFQSRTPTGNNIGSSNIIDNSQSLCTAVEPQGSHSQSTKINEIDTNSPEHSFVYSSTSQTNTRTSVLLKVVPVIVSGPAGSVHTHALLDDGSTATLLDAELANRIGATGPRGKIRVDGVGGMSKETNVCYVEFYIQGRHMDKAYLIRNARSIPSLSLRSQTIRSNDIACCEHVSDIIQFLTYEDATPTVLIGAGDWYLSITRVLREGTRSQPVASQTLLGWVLHGAASNKTKPIEFINHASFESEDGNDNRNVLENLIKEQYKLDSIGITKQDNVRNSLEKQALQILDDTTRRLPSGRFEVGLLWRNDISEVPDSYPQALSRLKNLEKRMAKDKSFANSYKENMSAMIEKGYAEECPSTSYYDKSKNRVQNGLLWYLPHFAVIHPQKRKLRVVHDAAAKSRGVSLNSLLLIGPDLLQPLLSILFKFREGKVALNADIKEMFPQVKIRPKDRDALRYLWRDGDMNAPIKEFRMSSVIFGAACSPTTAQFVKNKNAKEMEKEYPTAAHAIFNDHYMDDFIGSLDDVHEAAKLAADIIAVHKNACFEMRGWVSNYEEALSLVPLELRAVQPSDADVGLGSALFDVRTLGLIWNPKTDTISFHTALSDLPKQLTKRQILSQVMRIYDPLGLLAPIVIKGRIMFQKIWRTGIDWDSQLPTSDYQQWIEWFHQLSKVDSFSIPRWYLNTLNPIESELHVFADASELAYACVAYWRFIYCDGTVKLSLVASKSRVTPLKPVSIPRLELQAAVIASRLANTICDDHRRKPTKCYFWTDSMTVLNWLRNDARTFKPFVAFRVGEIAETTNISDWRWVPSGLNVADDATRVNIESLNSSSRWILGPSFLLEPSNKWPIENSGSEVPPVLKELKRDCKEMVGVLIERLPIMLSSQVAADPSRFSEWCRLVRATACAHQCAEIFRSFLPKYKKTNSNLPTNPVPPTDSILQGLRVQEPLRTSLLPLTVLDLLIAEQHILRQSQVDSFCEDLQYIISKQCLPKNSRLYKLSPMLGDDKLLRLAGRIKATPFVEYGVKNPIILDGRHPAVRLLVRNFHKKYAHANNELVVNELRQIYWILHIRNTVRKVAKECQFCRIRKALPLIPPIGDLPPERLAHHHRPFTYVGLDYFGPMQISIGRRQEKRYVALYTCLTCRAIHLEIVGSLSSDAAIMSLRRFISRRGTPTKIFSDNGTAFVGARRQLIELYSEAVTEFAANQKIQWSFIPPAAPFMGGSWERLVRSVKTALSVTLFQKTPKEEVLNTLLLEAEAIVNSRPLTHVSVDSEDDEALTPFHFILGSSAGERMPIILDDNDLLRRSDWKKAMRLSDHFWTRWLKEYLPTLLPKTSTVPYRNLEIGDTVLIVDPQLPRRTWPRGRVTSVHPGKDGVVRVVDVATPGGTLRRPAKRIVLLPTKPSVAPV